MTPHRDKYDREKIALALLSGRKWHAFAPRSNRRERRMRKSIHLAAKRRNARFCRRMDREASR